LDADHPANRVPFARRSTLSIPSRSLVNGQIGIKSREGKWDLFLFGQNLFDRKYIVSRGGGGFAFPGIGASTVESYGAPRSIGVRGTVHF
jgi:outer membrane receptor protein involved in Fe transport